jgi:PAS domain S-box-containing protein
MARDISDRKEAENQLEDMFSFSDFMACVADLKTGYFKKISPSFTDHLGWSNKELLSSPIAEFVHPDDLEKTENAIKKQKKEGVKIAKFENRYKTKEGSYRWLEWGAHSIPEKGLSYSVAYDVTEQKKVQNELKEKLDELEKMNKLMVGRELKMIEIKEQLESLKKGRFEKINKKTWNEKFIEAIELEEGAIKELGGSYVNLIKESDINNGDKKAIIKLLKRLEKKLLELEMMKSNT